MIDKQYSGNIRQIKIIGFIMFTLICFTIGVLIIPEFLPNNITKIEIIGKNQALENNSIVYLIETTDGFYITSQTNYNRLLKGRCEVIISNKQITAFNHQHSKCNYTGEPLRLI